jgi:hypothetical protein
VAWISSSTAGINRTTVTTANTIAETGRLDRYTASAAAPREESAPKRLPVVGTMLVGSL